jgi:hypothetical protein
MSEVEAIRSLLGRTAESPPVTGPAERAPPAYAPSEPTPPDAPSGEGDEAVTHNPGPEPTEAADAVPAESPPPPADDATQAVAIEEPAAAMPPPVNRQASPRPMTTADPEWLKGRRGPAADAYRRLRRLFPS